MSNIPLWRNTPPKTKNQEQPSSISDEYIFPSARQALSEALRTIGLKRNSRVALPEWSSHCVISSVAKIATPIPMHEVVKHNLQVDAILLYEQWGWHFSENLESVISEKFPQATVIIDRVDSADINNDKRQTLFPNNNQIDLISLSKLLGLDGGGLAKINGNYISFKDNHQDEKLSANLWNNIKNIQPKHSLMNIHKNELQTLHKNLDDWLKTNNLEEALETESQIRKSHLQNIHHTKISFYWPAWMFSALNNGASPGIIPIFKDKTQKELEAIKSYILNTYNIETEIYNFNWSGDPIEPAYSPCLAFPIHGLINNMDRIMRELCLKF
jgi:hypothetical protein